MQPCHYSRGPNHRNRHPHNSSRPLHPSKHSRPSKHTRPSKHLSRCSCNAPPVHKRASLRDILSPELLLLLKILQHRETVLPRTWRIEIITHRSLVVRKKRGEQAGGIAVGLHEINEKTDKYVTRANAVFVEVFIYTFSKFVLFSIVQARGFISLIARLRKNQLVLHKLRYDLSSSGLHSGKLSFKGPLLATAGTRLKHLNCALERAALHRVIDSVAHFLAKRTTQLELKSETQLLSVQHHVQRVFVNIGVAVDPSLGIPSV